MAGRVLIDEPLTIPPSSEAASESVDSKAAAFLVTGFTIVAALIAAVGASPGTVVDRTLKNEPIGKWVAFGSVIVSIALAAAAYNWFARRIGLISSRVTRARQHVVLEHTRDSMMEPLVGNPIFDLRTDLSHNLTGRAGRKTHVRHDSPTCARQGLQSADGRSMSWQEH